MGFARVPEVSGNLKGLRAVFHGVLETLQGIKCVSGVFKGFLGRLRSALGMFQEVSEAF